MARLGRAKPFAPLLKAARGRAANQTVVADTPIATWVVTTATVIVTVVAGSSVATWNVPTVGETVTITASSATANWNVPTVGETVTQAAESAIATWNVPAVTVTGGSGATQFRRGPHAKGRARLRGRRMFWFVVSSLGAHFLRS